MGHGRDSSRFPGPQGFRLEAGLCRGFNGGGPYARGMWRHARRCERSHDADRPGASQREILPSDEPYRLGAEYFNRGDYGLAERSFREAVEKAPGDGASWVALASSYDRLRRFDFADRAYQRAIELCGETVQILNNQGYSQMLRGNLKSARAKFLQAAARDPDNPTILNNIRLLDGSYPYIAPAFEHAQVQ